jgi:hypothetical protein
LVVRIEERIDLLHHWLLDIFVLVVAAVDLEHGLDDRLDAALQLRECSCCFDLETRIPSKFDVMEERHLLELEFEIGKGHWLVF